MLPDSCRLAPVEATPDETTVMVSTHAEVTDVELINVTRNRFMVLGNFTDPESALHYASEVATLLNVDVKVDPAVLKEVLR